MTGRLANGLLANKRFGYGRLGYRRFANGTQWSEGGRA